MNECPNAMQLDHSERIATLESEVDELQDKVDDFLTMKDTLIELKSLSKEQAEYNKKFNEMYENSLVSNAEFSNTLKNINNNLNSLNTEMKGTNERIDNIEDRLVKIDNKSKIDLLELFKQYAIPAIMGGGIVYFILQIVGKI
jgi:Zn-dependent M32 family carboxypeptidase